MSPGPRGSTMMELLSLTPVTSPRPVSSWGILRALLDHQASFDETPLIIHIPDSALVTSLRSPPTSFTSEVTAWLNETVQLFLCPLVSLRHYPPVSVLVPNPQSSNSVCTWPRLTRSPASLLSLRLLCLLKPPSRSIPWAIVFRWEPCETLGPGGTSSRGTPCSSLWNSACNLCGVFKPNALVTWTVLSW